MATMSTRTIGLLGGMTYAASGRYYTLINNHVRDKLGGQNSASIILHSFNFQTIREAMDNGEWDKVTRMFTTAAVQTRQAGAGAFAICANYPHKVAEDVESQSGLPILHIADVVGAHLARLGIRKVGLLGNKAVMEETYITDRIATASGVNVISPPDPTIREQLHDAMMKSLPFGKVTEELQIILMKATRTLIDGGVEGIILGSTDLGFALKAENVPVPLFDTTAIHAAGIANWLLA